MLSRECLLRIEGPDSASPRLICWSGGGVLISSIAALNSARAIAGNAVTFHS
jgi:hypothetical protein